MKSAVIATLALLVGCTDLPGHDDPRESVEYLESGTCDGAMPACELLPAAQCGNGCSVTQGCYSPMLARCAAHKDGNSCETDNECDWRSYYNRCEPSDICDIWDFQVECQRDSSGCLWGSVCSGEPRGCSDFDSQPSCAANPSCTWTHEP